MEMMNFFNYYVYFIITVNTYLFKYVPVKLGFISLSLIGVLRIPEEFYLYKDKDCKFCKYFYFANIFYFLIPKVIVLF